MTGAGAILFPGQGSQALGMGLDLAEAEPAAREILSIAEEVLRFPLASILAGSDASELDRTDVCQPAILAVSLAAMAALSARRLVDRTRVVAVAGLSLGEYTALTWAGALAPHDALRLVRLRGEAMQRASEQSPSGMASLVGADEDKAAALCDAARGDGVLVVANILAPGQVAIAGTKEALERASALAREHGVRKVVPLSVAGAFHSPCMAGAAEALSEALESTEIRAPGVPVVMNVTAEPTRDPATIRDLLKHQLTAPVRWSACIDALCGLGANRFLEPAPGRQLTNMIKRQGREVALATCADAAELSAFVTWPGGST